jgi:hypothetical protein
MPPDVACTFATVKDFPSVVVRSMPLAALTGLR